MKKPAYLNPDLPEQARVADLVGRLSLKEKISLMYFIAPAIQRLGIPAYDHGNEALHGVVRPGTATVFPQAIALAATWNPALILRVADAVSDEARAKYNELRGKPIPQVSGLLTFWSPVVNMVRDPRWGRTQETYGEDPLLTGRIGAAFVRGLQGNHPRYLKAVSTPKHFAGNNEEHNRFGCPVTADGRYWHEFELPGYRACVRDGNAQSIMTAYNAINGIPCSGNHWLLTRVLRGTWGFRGYVVSDCGAISNMVDRHGYVDTPEEAAAVAVNAGMDLEGGWCCKYPWLFPDYLAKAVRKGLVSAGAVDRAVSRVLAGRMRLGMFDPPERVPFSRFKRSLVGCAKHRALARETARQSIVLLKNGKAGKAPLLPLNPARLRTVAVVGPNAALCQFGGYSGKPVHLPVSVLDGIRARCGKNARVIHVPWLSDAVTVVPSDRLIPGENYPGRTGLLGQYFAGARPAGKPCAERVDRELHFHWGQIEPDPYASAKEFSVRWTGLLNPPASGTYRFFVSSDGGVRVKCAGRTVLDAWTRKDIRQAPFAVHLEAGRPCPIAVEYSHDGGVAHIRLEWQTPTRLKEWIEPLRKADAVVAVLGLGTHIEEEGRDRTTLNLPREQDRFIRRLLAVNSRTVVVLEAGSPLAVPWIHEHVPAILMAWYPGEQGGHAIADVLFGRHNPAGRLPVTFYMSDKQLRPFDEYDLTRGRTYMYLRRKPLYAFGHGLSYTQFSYGRLALSKRRVDTSDTIRASLEVRNAGARGGDEVVQLYVRDLECSVAQPIRQLKAFRRVHLRGGEKRRVTLSLPVRELSFWDVKKEMFVVEPGIFEIQVGASSSDIRARARVTVCNGGYVSL